ncbi:retrovirus-related pol polyprotein from transposon TNT 1-94 [Tanacetum coccineum]
MNGPYVRRMIPEPRDPARTVPVPETFHEQTDDELTEAEIKQMEADDQAIQTILLGLPKDIYAAVDSCETAQEILLRVQQMMKEKIASNLKFLNNLQPEWSQHVTIAHQTKDLHTADYTQLYDFLKYNQKKYPVFHPDLPSSSTYIQQPLPNNNNYILQPSFNQNYMQQPMPNLKDITDPTSAMNTALALMAKAFKLNYSTPTNNNQRISSNPHNRQVVQPGNQVVQNAVHNPGVQNVGNQNGGNCCSGGLGHLISNCIVRPRRRDATYLQTQLLIAQKEEAGIQLQAGEFDLMAAAADLDKIEEVHANCILMTNLQQASTSGTQTNKAPVYDSDGSAEQYTELLEPIPEPHQVPQNDSNVISEVSSVEQGGGTVEQHLITLSKEKTTVSSLLEEKKRLKSDFKIREDELLDKQVQLENKIKELDNILVKTVLLEKLNPPIVYDSEETLQLAQESRLKMKQINKEIESANYTKINHLSGVFVSQTTMSREELYLSNTFNMANVSKSISIPNEEFSDDTTPSVARKFLNEVKSTIVTLQRVVKQKMTLDIHNWSSSAHQEIHKIVKDEIFPIVNQVDARVQNFEIQFLQEATKFVRDFQSLANEADESLAMNKALELEIERLLRAVVSQDIMSIVQNNSVVDTSNLQTELDRTKERFENCIIKKENEYAKLWNDWYKKCEECKYDKISYDKAYNDMHQKIERLQAQLGDQKGKSKDTPYGSNTLDPLPQKLENENVELEFQNKLHDTIYENAKLRAQLFDKVSDQKDTTKVTSNSVPTTEESKVFDNDKVIAPRMFRINPFKNPRVEKFVPNKPSKASVRTNPITASQPHVIIKKAVNSDSNDLEVAFRRNTCFIRNLKGDDLLKGNHITNLYTINLHDMASASPICLMARATSTKSWLWHQRLSHLNFDTINDLARNDLVTGLPKFKYHKEHLCPSCEQGKTKGLHTHPNVFQIQSRGDFKSVGITHQVLQEYFKSVGITHQASSIRTPQQNRVMEQRNSTLVEAAGTMLIFFRAPLFLWAEAIATVCYTQNCSIIHRRFDKTPYELINGRKPDISFLHVFRRPL